jgi:hypothetical protein
MEGHYIAICNEVFYNYQIIEIKPGKIMETPLIQRTIMSRALKNLGEVQRLSKV